jgi:uncharacterized protein (DUF2147 family)
VLLSGRRQHLFGDHSMHARRTIAWLVFDTFLALVAWPTLLSAGEVLEGFWIDSDGEVILQIAPCGSALCGKVAWLKQPLGTDGRALRDSYNPEPALRNRPVCGLEVVSGFKKQVDGSWGDGTVYVSDQGMSYSGHAEVLSPSQVKVTGYLGFTIFGASEVWSRMTKPFDRCWDDNKKNHFTSWTVKVVPARTHQRKPHT